MTFKLTLREGGQLLPVAVPERLLTCGFEQVQSIPCLLAIPCNRAFGWIFFSHIPEKTSSETFLLIGSLIFTLTL